MQSTDAVTQICDRLTNAVIRCGALTVETIDLYRSVAKVEIEAFLFGEEYASHRECLRLGSLSDATVFVSLVTNVVAKMKVA